jgi:hypothetical protein
MSSQRLMNWLFDGHSVIPKFLVTSWLDDWSAEVHEVLEHYLSWRFAELNPRTVIGLFRQHAP